MWFLIDLSILELIFSILRQGVLDSKEAKRLIQEAQDEMIKTKERLDAERLKQEAALHKKLSERKKQKMEETVSSHPLPLYPYYLIH